MSADGQRLAHRLLQLRGRVDPRHLHAHRRLEHDRAGNELHVGTALPRRLGEPVSHLAARAIGDDAHRIDRLARGTRRHHHPLPGQPAVAPQQSRGMRRNGVRLTHPPGTARRPFRQRPDVGTDDGNPAPLEQRQVHLRLWMGEHLVVHGRSEQHRRRGREQQAGQCVVSQPLRHARDQLRRGGSHDHHVGLLAPAHVVERRVAIPQRHQHRPAGQCLEGHRPHEFRGRTGQHHIDPRAGFGEVPGEIAALVAGDPARHAEDDVPAGPHRHASERRRRTSL